MKGKLLVILLLLGLLAYTIYKMMKYEQSVREDHIITKYVEDDTKPLIEKMSPEQIQSIVEDLDINFNVGNNYFNKKTTNEEQDEWNTLLLKGVNIGVAVPGKFPAQFSLTFKEYLDWLIKIGEMNANTIRLYTILPPEFYKAFAYYNLHYQNKPIYLLQGVWATDPEDKNYYNPAYVRRFQKEIIDVLDVLNGNAVLKANPGKANGIYATNVSKFVAGLLLGREWEPKSVYQTVKKNNINHYNGTFISIADANSMEVWLAEMMDFTVRYSTQNYQNQFPVSFVNWLPLDNIYHSTEYIENDKVREYDNDLKSIDFRKFNSSDLFKAGIYAAYHVYPYYPDFINIDPKYANSRNKKGEKDNFYGYLKDLKKHNEGIPLVIAEYGLPTSRGISHFAYTGFHQGGHSEYEQAKKSLTLTKDIFDTHCAGAIYFEWADEWFKHNWLVQDFEIPFKNRVLWHNMENPEQNFGIIALEDKRHTIDGNLNDWNLSNGDIMADADATYFYIAGNFSDFDFAKNNLYIAIDTYDKEKGDHKLPFSNQNFENGFEFLCVFKSLQNAGILVDNKYSVYTDIYNDSIPVYASKPNDDGIFVNQNMLVNRGRKTLCGVKNDSLVNNRSPLVFGNSHDAKTSNCDWNYSEKNHNFELRLDWHLLNVSDPSHRYVLDDNPGTKEIEASTTDGFRVYLFVTSKDDKILRQIPADKPYFFTWDEWSKPVFAERAKPLYDTLQNYFKTLHNRKDTTINVSKESFAIADFFGNKKGAISISFDNAGFSQYRFAFPELVKYNLTASFGVVKNLLDINPNYTKFNEGKKIKRLGLLQLNEMLKYGNEIALQSISGDFDYKNTGIPSLKTGIITLHNPDVVSLNKLRQSSFIFRKKTGIDSILSINFDNIHYNLVNTSITEFELDSLLKVFQGQWSILQYYHIKRFDKSDTTFTAGNRFFIDYEKFQRQIRIARNTDYWIATESSVFKYLKEKSNSKIDTKKYGNSIYLNIYNNLKSYRQVLTVLYKTNAKTVKITGAATDGYFTNRTGVIQFDVYPNKEVKIEKIN